MRYENAFAVCMEVPHNATDHYFLESQLLREYNSCATLLLFQSNSIENQQH